MRSKLTNPNSTKFREDGSLTIHYGINNYHAVKILPWHEGCHVLVKRNLGWEYNDGDVDYVLVNMAYEGFSKTALTLYSKSIPQDIKLRLSKFRVHQTRMLHLIASLRGGRDLFDSNPVLLWLLLSWAENNKIDMTVIKESLDKKQKNILKLIYPNAQNKHVKLLKKLSFSAYNKKHISLVMALISMLNDFSQLGHCNTIDNEIAELTSNLELSNNRERRLMNAILRYHQSGGEKSIKDSMGTYKDCLNMQATLFPNSLIPPFMEREYSIEELNQYHDKLVRDYNDPYINTSLTNKFPEKCFYPKPFVPGNERIVHINNMADLYAEGRSMKHCIASYHHSILSEISCIYKVLHPQRATLELIRTNGYYSISQVKLKSNKEPSIATMIHIRRWLEDAS